jgi:hypothetical protein
MKHIPITYTVKWTQKYPVDYVTVDLRKINAQLNEQRIEEVLTRAEFTEALAVIDIIRNKQ